MCVRRADYDQGHLPGAISVPFAEFKDRLQSLKLPKFDPIILYGTDDVHAREMTKTSLRKRLSGRAYVEGRHRGVARGRAGRD
jgi:rhodanese-related sulfurtransferase